MEGPFTLASVFNTLWTTHLTKKLCQSTFQKKTGKRWIAFSLFSPTHSHNWGWAVRTVSKFQSSLTSTVSRYQARKVIYRLTTFNCTVMMRQPSLSLYYTWQTTPAELKCHSCHPAGLSSISLLWLCPLSIPKMCLHPPANLFLSLSLPAIPVL